MLRQILATATAMSFMALRGSTRTEPSPREVIDRAVSLMGGEDAIRAVQSRTTRYSMTVVANLAQEDWPGAPKPTVTTVVTEHADWARDRFWNQRNLGPASAANQPPRTIGWVIDQNQAGFRNDTAWNVSSRASAGSAAQLLDFIVSAPERVMQLALAVKDGELRALGSRLYRGRKVSGIELRVAGVQVRLWFDTIEGFPICGDWIARGGTIGGTETVYEYGMWDRFGDLTLPRAIRISPNGEMLFSKFVSNVEFNVPLADSMFVIPLRPSSASTSLLRVNELAPGVFRLEGATHSSLAVRQGNELVLLETPASPQFARALLDTLRLRFPRVPVKRFVSTHFHGDHASGVSEAFASGLQAYVPAGQAEFYRTVGKRWDEPRPKRAIVEVSDSLVIGSGPSRFILYRIPTSHVWGLLIAYFPEPQLLFEADLQNSGQRTMEELRDFVRAKGWTPQRVSGVHGELVSWEEFLGKIKE